MIISRTPFRISFFGGGTDYPTWFRDHGGCVLTSSINKYCHISARYLPPFFEKRNRIVWSKIEAVDSIEEIQHPAVRAGLQFLDVREGVEIHHDGDLPARSGLGSSSAFTVGLLHALYGLKGVMASKSRLANEAIYLEQDVLNEAVGIQDQIQVAHGGLNLIDIREDASYQVRPIMLPRERSRELRSYMMLYFTGLSRFASQIAQAQVAAIPQKTRELKAMAAFVDGALGVLTSTGPLDDFGALLHESWLLKRGLTDQVSNDTVDDIYEAARGAGALGGKLLGAGGGGFMLIFASPGKQPQIRQALHGLLEIPFEFDFAGTQIIYCENGATL